MLPVCLLKDKDNQTFALTWTEVWLYAMLNHMKQTGREWGESWEEMVSWPSWLFELVHLKWASSASTLTWCCSRLWHASIPSDWHTHAHTVSHTYSHTQAHTHTHTRSYTETHIVHLAFRHLHRPLLPQPPRCAWHSTHDPSPRRLWAVRLTGHEEVDMWHCETGSNVSLSPLTKKERN